MANALANFGYILVVIEVNLFHLESSDRFPLYITTFQGPRTNEISTGSGQNRVSPKSVEPKNLSPTPQLFLIFQTVFIQPRQGFLFDVHCHAQPANELLQLRNPLGYLAGVFICGGKQRGFRIFNELVLPLGELTTDLR